MSFGDSISHEHEREFAELKRSRGTMVRLLLALIVLGCGVAFIMAALSSVDEGAGGLEAARSELASSVLPAARGVAEMQPRYAEWLGRHGTAGEAVLFEKISRLILSNLVDTVEGYRDGGTPGIFSRVFVSLHGSVLRVAFILTASWRLWLVVLLGCLVWTIRGFHPYAARDLLGATGNGRIFYSGARVDLSHVTPAGAPDILLPGLACPPIEPATVVRASPLGKCLLEADAFNDTTAALAGIILKRSSDPAFVADADDEAHLTRAYAGGSLAEHSAEVLRRALELHSFYHSAIIREETDDNEARPPFLAAPAAGPASPGAYADAVQAALHRVLTPGLRRELGKLSTFQIAALVLGLEAGKVMVHAREANRWIRRSRFPHLCSRAILHSLPAFSTDFDAEARADIRRAFVYGSRKSDFAPVRFPLDFSPPSRAARQWVEILMALPHELPAVADEVELLALVTEGYQQWTDLFFADEPVGDSHFAGTYATHGNLVLMPLAGVLGLLRRAVSEESRARIEVLMTSVSARQRAQSAARESSSEGERPLVHDRVLTPLLHGEMKDLAAFHGAALDDVRAWSALRLVLNSFGWLGRRVGDNTVPESSLVAAVLQVGVGAAGANALGLVARRGLVPLRATHLELMWGRQWRARFEVIDRARAAENSEELEKLLRGIDEREEELSQMAGTGV